MSAKVIRTNVAIVLLAFALIQTVSARGETIEGFCEDYHYDIVYFKANTEELSDVEKALARAQVNQLIREAIQGKDTYFCEIDKVHIKTYVTHGFSKKNGYSEAQENGIYIRDIFLENKILDDHIKLTNVGESEPSIGASDALFENHRVEILLTSKIGDRELLIDWMVGRIENEYNANSE